MSKRLKFLLLILVFVIVLAISLYINQKYFKDQKAEVKITSTPVLSPSSLFTPTSTSTPTPIETKEEIPNSFMIENFPFQSQAPFANWDELHDEACEEAALILVYYYFSGKSLSKEVMDEQILKMVDWQIQKWGSHKDLTVSEVGEVAHSFYSMDNFKFEENIGIDDIKQEIAQGHPVILPTAGRLLGNPYFRSPGPVYHMVVAIGYDNNTIIVQDVGTRRGDHYKYSQTILFNAIHDWNGSYDNIEQGPKNILVFW